MLYSIDLSKGSITAQHNHLDRSDQHCQGPNSYGTSILAILLMYWYLYLWHLQFESLVTLDRNERSNRAS